MSSDKQILTMAEATGLIFSFFDVISVRDVPFAILLYIQSILHGLTSVLLCVQVIVKSVDFVIGT